MDQIDANWSKEIREMISKRIEEEGSTDMAEAVILTERVKREAPKGWDALTVIKQWRKRMSS